MCGGGVWAAVHADAGIKTAVRMSSCRLSAGVMVVATLCVCVCV